VAHTLATDAGKSHFDAAPVTNDATVFNALILAAGTLPVFDRAEDAFAEQATLLGFESAVIDGFRVF